MSLFGVPGAACAKHVHGGYEVEQMAARKAVRAVEHRRLDTGLPDSGQQVILARVRGEPHNRRGAGAG